MEEKVYVAAVAVAAGAHVVERWAGVTVFSGLADMLVGLEDERQVVGCSIVTAGLLVGLLAEHDGVRQACLERLDSCLLEACAYKRTHW